VLLPLVSFLTCILLFRRADRPLRETLLHSAVAWGVLVVALTELLSLVRLMTVMGLTVAWGAVDFALILAVLASAGRGALVWRRVVPEASAKWTLVEAVLLAGVVLVVLVTGVVAIVAAPDTWDAMESHLPRAFFWAQNGGVALYPSPHFLQNLATPFAQYAIAQSFVLLGDDRAANLPQFLAMVGSLVAVSLIARELGGDRGAQLFAALICATIPEGVLEASGAQNTYVGAFWIVVAVYFLLRAGRVPSWSAKLSCAGAVGLALLTKGTAYTLLPPLLLALWLAAPSRGRLALLAAAPVMAAVVLMLNAGFYLRNYALTGTPLGVPYPPAGQLASGYGNATLTLGGTVANVLRNVSLHLGLPGGERLLQPIFVAAMHAIGQEPNDPTHTWPGQAFRWPYYMGVLSRDEIYTGNQLHLMLAIVAMGLLLRGLRTPCARTRLLYAAGLVGSFVLFCALLRYTIWSSRYHIPLFVLAAPLSAVAFWRQLGPRWSCPTGLVLLLASLPQLFGNELRSLAPGARSNIFEHERAFIYFADMHHDQAVDFRAAVASLDDDPCAAIGILADLPAPESSLAYSPKAFYVYPVLALLHRRNPTRRFAYVDVRNSSSRYQSPEPFQPCAIICLDCARDPTAGSEFSLPRRRVFGDTVVLSRAND
jgi:hypothetical protein